MSRFIARKWREPYTVLSLCIGSYFAVRFTQVVIGPVVPLVLETFAVSRGAIGTVLTGMWAAYALAQLPSGMLADRIGERRVVCAALTVTAGAGFGLAGAPTVVLFAAAAVMIGIGAGMYYNPATALLTREFNEIGGAIGTHRIGGQIAGVAAPLVVAIVTPPFGWRPAIALGAVCAIAVGVLFAWIQDSQPSQRPDASFRDLYEWQTVSTLFARPHIRTTTLLMTLVEFVGLATMAFVPTLLVESYRLSVGRANIGFALFFAVSALCQPLGGWLSDRIGRDRTLVIQSTAGIIGYGALAMGWTVAVAVPALVLIGGATSATPVLQSRMIDGLSDATRGTGFGLFRTLYLLGGASGTAIIGTTADLAGWGGAFGLLSALFGGVLVSVLVVNR